MFINIYETKTPNITTKKKILTTYVLFNYDVKILAHARMYSLY